MHVRTTSERFLGGSRIDRGSVIVSVTDINKYAIGGTIVRLSGAEVQGLSGAWTADFSQADGRKLIPDKSEPRQRLRPSVYR